MSCTVWIVDEGQASALFEPLSRLLETTSERPALRMVMAGDLGVVARQAYGTQGLLVLDARTSSGREVLAALELAFVPAAAIAPSAAYLPPGVARLAPDDLALQVHGVLELLKRPANLRRHPRARLELPIEVNGTPATMVDASSEGLWVGPAHTLKEGQAVKVRVKAERGALTMMGEVVSLRQGGAVLRATPVSDEDLVLWLALLMDGMSQSLAAEPL